MKLKQPNTFARSRRALLGSVAGLLLAGSLRADDQRKPGDSTVPTNPIPRFLIGPGDVLQVSVWKEPEASIASVVVRSDGIITLPLLREIEVAGMTTAELEALLTKRYAKLIRDPDVSVIVKEIHSEKIYLIGAVRKEGPIVMKSPLNVLQAIAEAGGLTDYAKRSKIYILRPENGKQVTLRFDYSAVIKGEQIESNITLRPGDTIVVPQ